MSSTPKPPAASASARGRFYERLRHLAPSSLRGLRRGIEKESLRVTPQGRLALTPHPEALGAALTHPHITTDFSEAQLELITGVHANVEACLTELAHIHQIVNRHLPAGELLWCASMPCGLPPEEDIPIARYGRSNIGRAKTVYRIGLSHRYGRRMQTISGIHYNFSLPEQAFPVPGLGAANEAYFALIRNFRRHAWLLLYLFGASPAVCASFVEGRAHELRELAPGTLYLPHATSLRMGRLGYLSEAQDSLAVSYNCLESYAASLQDALTQPYPAYQQIGLRQGDDYRQLATTLLQIENEFYSTIRPKRAIEPGERPLHALRSRGVQYVEDRAMDLDPFSPVGITAATARFLDVFLLHCLLAESPPDTPQELGAINRNKQRVAARGREFGLRLERGAQTVELREWAGQLLAECEPVSQALDAAHGGERYTASLADALAALEDPRLLPSTRVLAAIDACGGSYLRFGLEQSVRNREALREWPLSAQVDSAFRRMAAASLAEQRAIEAADTLDFEAYRQRYLSPERLLGD